MPRHIVPLQFEEAKDWILQQRVRFLIINDIQSTLSPSPWSREGEPCAQTNNEMERLRLNKGGKVQVYKSLFLLYFELLSHAIHAAR